MKAQSLDDRVWQRFARTGETYAATVAIECARLAPSIGYHASKQAAVSRGCPVALWRIAYLCEMGQAGLSQ